MRLINGAKYSLVGYNSGGDFIGWVFRERSVRPGWDTALVIVDEAKFIHDGGVSFLKRDGVLQGAPVQCVGLGQPAYAIAED